jgi:hypothetical protein
VRPIQDEAALAHELGHIQLVSFQLDRPNGTDADQGMSLLANTTICDNQGTGRSSAGARGVVRIVRASQGRTFGDTEVRLNSVEPGGLGRRPHRVNVQPPEPSR